MSHRVVINYEAIAIECRSICEVASKQLCQIDELLQRLDETSQSLQGGETDGMKRRLRERARTIRERMDEIVKQSEIQVRLGTVVTDTDFLRGGDGRGVVAAARALSREVNVLTTADIARYEALLDSLLKSKLAEHTREMRLRASGTVAISAEFSARLAEIDDEALKGFVYIEWLDNRNVGKTFEELKALAESKMKDGAENYFKANRKKIIAGIETEMRATKLDDETIAATLAAEGADTGTIIAEIREKATKELISEAVRKKTLKVVKECIESKGFIVDGKNIKLNREKNEVVMVAQKAGGEQAEFRVMLDGRFIYDFNGYEGQACQNDIKPFMRDLEEIYGVKVTGREEIWSNPDKLSTQKYQQMKTKTDKG
jgi:hypothetical protein